MDTEELKQEARQKALEWNGEKINGKYNRPPIANWSCYEKGYLAGAEPREKRIADLEEENAELKKKLKEELKTIADKDLSFVARFDVLERENAELKEQLRDKKCNDKDCPVFITLVQAIKERAETSKQLTKAKEIIKTFLGFAEAFGYSPSMDKFITEAEQFLNSEV